MKTHKNTTLLLSALIGSAALSLTSCSSDDNNMVKPDDKIEVPAAKATLKLSLGSVSDSTILFSIEAQNTTSVFYYISPALENGTTPIIAEEEIFAKGTEIKDWKESITVDQLNPSTTYHIFAAAKNSNGVTTILELPLTAKTTEKADVFLDITNVSSTHEQILFSILPKGAKEVRYKIVKKETILTLEQVLETGSKLFNLNAVSNLKPKNFEPDTEYTLYVAAISNTEMKILKAIDIKTKKTGDAVDDGTVSFSSLTFTSELVEEAGQKVAYYQLSFANTDWQAQFEIGALTSIVSEIKEGKYILPSKKDSGKPGPDRIASNFVIKDLKTGKILDDIDYGEIVIAKVNNNFEIKIDLVKLNYKDHFIAIYKGVPTHK